MSKTGPKTKNKKHNDLEGTLSITGLKAKNKQTKSRGRGVKLRTADKKYTRIQTTSRGHNVEQDPSDKRRQQTTTII